ncbi:unnamed protein product [Malus baccata var. baccata]
MFLWDKDLGIEDFDSKWRSSALALMFDVVHSSFHLFVCTNYRAQNQLSWGSLEGSGWYLLDLAALREEVIRLIPRVIYADPRASRLATVEDAFEIAVKGVLGKVQKTRKDMKEEKNVE